MNERIEQLAEQCWTHTNEPLFSVRSPHWEFDRHKFAESIVKECCTVLAKCKEEPFPFDEDYACRLLKIHFGVE